MLCFFKVIFFTGRFYNYLHEEDYDSRTILDSAVRRLSKASSLTLGMKRHTFVSVIKDISAEYRAASYTPIVPPGGTVDTLATNVDDVTDLMVRLPFVVQEEVLNTLDQVKDKDLKYFYDAFKEKCVLPTLPELEVKKASEPQEGASASLSRSTASSPPPPVAEAAAALADGGSTPSPLSCSQGSRNVSPIKKISPEKEHVDVLAGKVYGNLKIGNNDDDDES